MSEYKEKPYMSNNHVLCMYLMTDGEVMNIALYSNTL